MKKNLTENIVHACFHNFQLVHQCPLDWDWCFCFLLAMHTWLSVKAARTVFSCTRLKTSLVLRCRVELFSSRIFVEFHVQWHFLHQCQKQPICTCLKTHLKTVLPCSCTEKKRIFFWCVKGLIQAKFFQYLHHVFLLLFVIQNRGRVRVSKPP